MNEKLITVQTYSKLSKEERDALFKRSGLSLQEVRANVILPLAGEFKNNAARALTDAQLRYDGFVAEKMVLEHADLAEAFERVKRETPELIAAFQSAAENITLFHEAQKQHPWDVTIKKNTLGMKFVPFSHAALYVPGGKALYPSTVLMGVLPAKIAGVNEVTLLTPPEPTSKRVADTVLAMAHLAGADRVLQAGGAQAIFAAALGIEELSLKRANFIYGPGNIYVSAAKIHVQSENLCGIDSFAGPSEVMVIADDSANARFVAHDLMAQAEHDENAQAILLTPSRELISQVEKEIVLSLACREDDEKRKQITLESIRRNGRAIVVSSLDEAMEISNEYAPEHLEIQTCENMRLLDNVRSAGSVFVGSFAPVAAGDYYTGTNHILPTAGTAHFNSGVSVYSFYKRITWQSVTPEGLEMGKDAISAMSKAEGLFAEHGYSVLTRFEKPH